MDFSKDYKIDRKVSDREIDILDFNNKSWMQERAILNGIKVCLFGRWNSSSHSIKPNNAGVLELYCSEKPEELIRFFKDNIKKNKYWGPIFFIIANLLFIILAFIF